MKYLDLIASIFIFNSAVISQESYTGKVVDTQAAPVAFAHIFFNSDQTRGAITNAALCIKRSYISNTTKLSN